MADVGLIMARELDAELVMAAQRQAAVYVEDTRRRGDALTLSLALLTYAYSWLVVASLATPWRPRRKRRASPSRWGRIGLRAQAACRWWRPWRRWWSAAPVIAPRPHERFAA
jgi:hypothetical protein